jgi:spermidine synthase
MTRIPPAGVFFALFTISGFAGLIYQSIWSHYLKLFLGHAAYAQTLVLGIFMGGMALGAWLVSRFTGRIRNLLLGYAFAELGIGVLAIAFHRVFIAATGWAYDSVLPGLGGASVDLFKWALASALILPASVLLGTTFPLMSAGIMRLHPGHGGRALSMLYFTNSFGAAIGVLASGFFLIDRFGLPGTILTAGILNVLLALVVWALARRVPVAVPGPADAAAIATARGAGRKFAFAVLMLAFATGIASFIYEVTWIRMLTLGLGASTHAFEVMIAAFILAMSLGAFWFRNRIQAIRDDVAWLAGLLVAKAVFAAWAVWIYPDVLGFLGWMMQAVARSEGGYTLATLSGMVASMIVMFPTAFCAGMTLPLATHVLTARGFGEASIGRVYGANTAGCIVGAAFATHLGMEALGVKGLTAAGAALDVAVAVLVLWAAADRARRRAAMASVAVASVAGVALFAAAKMDLVRMSSGVYRDGYFHDPAETKVTFYRDGKTATIAVTEVGGRRAIRTNGKPDASVEYTPGKRAAPDESTMLLAAALPLAMKPDARSIANIGFGSGLTTQALLGSPQVREVDSIEIERMMIEGARLFSPRNDRAYNDPRSHIHIEDAKTFFATRGKRYDIIVSEPSNPWVSGVSTLFSEEFYAHTKRYLADDGLLVQWVQGYEIDLGLLSTIFAALGKHYSDYAVYRNSLDLLVVATPRGRLPPMRDDIFSFAGLSADLAFLGYRGRHDLEALRVGGRRALEPLFRSTGYPANSDFFPVLDQRAPKARFRAGQITGLVNLRDDFVPALALLDVDTRSPHDAAGPRPGNRPPRVDQAAGAAEAVAVAMSGAADAAHGLAPEPRMAATLFHRLAGDCRGASAQWLGALQAVMQAALPFLAASDLAPLLAKARASACMKSLDELGSRRLALLEAMNAQDALAMAEHATWALQRLPPQLESERAFLVTAALAGAVASGNRALAQALAAQHVPRLPRRDRESVQMQLLLGHLALR